MPLALADDKVDAWLDLSDPDPLKDDLLLDLKVQQREEAAGIRTRS